MDKPVVLVPEALLDRFWAGNREPARLWGLLKEDLEPSGFTWAKWLRFLKTQTNLMLRYELDIDSASILIGELTLMAKGPLGKYILEL